ncbi:hypothetical protein SAFG77S_01493 [Streptomyces afghaniensis]
MPSATTTTSPRAGTAPVRQAPTPAPGLFLTLIAVCSAVTAANIYLAAPLLSLMARDFGSAPSAIAWIASVAQLGYAVGLLFFAPLGDSANRRRLVGGLTLVTAAALVASAAAPGVTALAVAMFVASAATVIPQLLVPLVAERAPAERRGRHVAAVIAGLFAGIVAARVLGGLAGQAFGWRWVFAGAAVLTLVLGLATVLVLPSQRRREGPLFAGLAALPSVLRHSPDLWRACLRQAGMFGAWSALWTSLALLLTGPEYGLSTATAGLFGLFGLTASAVAPPAGGLVRPVRGGACRAVRVSARGRVRAAVLARRAHAGRALRRRGADPRGAGRVPRRQPDPRPDRHVHPGHRQHRLCRRRFRGRRRRLGPRRVRLQPLRLGRGVRGGGRVAGAGVGSDRRTT